MMRLLREAVGAPFLRGIQGQVEWRSGQPDLVGGALMHGAGLELDGL